MVNTQRITVQGDRLVDPQGRHVILHGINLVNKDPAAGCLGDEGPELFAAMRDWGFNCIRLGIIWDGLEPEPGVYDETYLQGIDRQIAWAKENDLVVFLDMHKVKLTPAANGFEVAPTSQGSDSVHIEIPPAGQACTRHLVIGA